MLTKGLLVVLVHSYSLAFTGEVVISPQECGAITACFEKR